MLYHLEMTTEQVQALAEWIEPDLANVKLSQEEGYVLATQGDAHIELLPHPMTKGM